MVESPKLSPAFPAVKSCVVREKATNVERSDVRGEPAVVVPSCPEGTTVSAGSAQGSGATTSQEVGGSFLAAVAPARSQSNFAIFRGLFQAGYTVLSTSFGAFCRAWRCSWWGIMLRHPSRWEFLTTTAFEYPSPFARHPQLGWLLFNQLRYAVPWSRVFPGEQPSSRKIAHLGAEKDDIVSAAQPLDLSGEEVFVVTGASGGIGSHTAQQLEGICEEFARRQRSRMHARSGDGERAVILSSERASGAVPSVVFTARTPGSIPAGSDARLVRQVNLSSLASVRDFVDSLAADKALIARQKNGLIERKVLAPRSVVLVNNAGVMGDGAAELEPRRQGDGSFSEMCGLDTGDALVLTDDGFGVQFQSNYLGHYLLTRLLVERGLLKRVVHVSSLLHFFGDFGVEDVAALRAVCPIGDGVVGRSIGDRQLWGSKQGEPGVRGGRKEGDTSGTQAAVGEGRLTPVLVGRTAAALRFTNRYYDTKLMNNLFSNALARKVPSCASNAVHPGSVGTSIMRKSPFLHKVHQLIGRWRLGSIPPEEAAAAVVWVVMEAHVSTRGDHYSDGIVASPEQVSGRYFSDMQERHQARLAKDVALQDALWDATEAMLRDAGFWPGEVANAAKDAVVSVSSG